MNGRKVVLLLTLSFVEDPPKRLINTSAAGLDSNGICKAVSWLNKFVSKCSDRQGNYTDRQNVQQGYCILEHRERPISDAAMYRICFPRRFGKVELQ